MNNKLNTEEVSKYVRYILSPIVEHKDVMVVEATVHSETLLISLYPAKTDIGRVTGRKGSLVKSLTAMVNAAYAKGNYQTVIEIIDPEGRTNKDRTRGNNRQPRHDSKN